MSDKHQAAYESDAALAKAAQYLDGDTETKTDDDALDELRQANERYQAQLAEKEKFLQHQANELGETRKMLSDLLQRQQQPQQQTQAPFDVELEGEEAEDIVTRKQMLDVLKRSAGYLQQSLASDLEQRVQKQLTNFAQGLLATKKMADAGLSETDMQKLTEYAQQNGISVDQAAELLLQFAPARNGKTRVAIGDNDENTPAAPRRRAPATAGSFAQVMTNDIQWLKDNAHRPELVREFQRRYPARYDAAMAADTGWE